MSKSSKFLFCLILLPILSYGQIVGQDDRFEVEGNQNPPRFNNQLVAGSVAAMIHKDYVKKVGDSYEITAPSLKQKHNMCDGTRFERQLSAVKCTGFMLAAYTMVTSINCVKTMRDCEDYYWVFNYQTKKVDQDKIKVKELYVRKCSWIVDQGLILGTNTGHTFFQLDKRGPGVPISLETMKPLEDGASVYSVAHPYGLPAKYLKEGKLEKVGRNLTPLELDLNSPGIEGAPVFSGEDNTIVGMIVRGDFEEENELDPEKNCYRPRRCLDNCASQSMINILSLF